MEENKIMTLRVTIFCQEIIAHIETEVMELTLHLILTSVVIKELLANFILFFVERKTIHFSFLWC